jgi:hypothetical protein
VAAAELKRALRGARGHAAQVLRTILHWNGFYAETNAAGTVSPGVAAWQTFKDKLQALALAPLGAAGRMVGRFPGLGSLINNSSSISNPGQYLDYLRATASGSVQDLGPATASGVRTTHYHAIVDLAKVPAAVPGSERAAAQQLVAALRSHGASTRAPVDVWIDSAHLIRRYRMG